MRTIFVKRNGDWVNKATGELMVTEVDMARPAPSPRVFSDIPAYFSPIDGRLIDGRRERIEDMKRNNCVDANDFPSATGGKLKNKAFCEKRGLQVSEEYRD